MQAGQRLAMAPSDVICLVCTISDPTNRSGRGGDRSSATTDHALGAPWEMGRRVLPRMPQVTSVCDSLCQVDSGVADERACAGDARSPVEHAREPSQFGVQRVILFGFELVCVGEVIEA